MGQTRGMASRADHAKVALRIVQGIAQGHPDADDLIAAAFDDATTASVAYAYLAGFLLEALAASEPSHSIEAAASEIRELLNRLE